MRRHFGKAAMASDRVVDPDRPRRGAERKWTIPQLNAAWRRRLRNVAVLLAVLLGMALAGRWLFERLTHVYVYDARIDAAVVAVSPQVAGRLVRVNVAEGEHVRAGQVLAEIDERQVQHALSAQRARLQAVTAQGATLRTRIHLTQRLTETQVAAERSHVEGAEAALGAARSDLELARTEFERAKTLVDSNAITRQQFDQRRAAYQAARQRVAEARAELARARAALASAEAEREQVAVLRHQLKEVKEQGDALRAEIARQQVDLDEHHIKSPLTGVIDEVFVDPGEYVTPGQRMLLIHDPASVWVNANVKETAIGEIRPGQRVQVVVDAYPDTPLEGVVAYVGDTATSEFALIPNPNPSGNFTKITQRVPVRIAIDNPAGLALRPGTMVVAGIDTARAPVTRMARRPGSP